MPACANGVPVVRRLRCFHGVLLPGETCFRCPGRGGPFLPKGIVSKDWGLPVETMLTKGKITPFPGRGQGEGSGISTAFVIIPIDSLWPQRVCEEGRSQKERPAPRKGP